jgi:hypothetical protein
MFNLQDYLATDLGKNSECLYNITKKYTNSIFVDLGVRTGMSSDIMLIDSEINNNKVFGIDVDFTPLISKVKENPNYTTILGDSSTVGKHWTNGEIGGLFIDTFHAKEQVLCELYHWYPHVKETGFIAFHDSNWPKDKYDFCGGIYWDRIDEAIKDFFVVGEDLNYEDEYFKMVTYPESWGMTIVELKQKKDFILLYKKWDEVFKKRNELMSLFWNEENKNNLLIELNLCTII